MNGCRIPLFLTGITLLFAGRTQAAGWKVEVVDPAGTGAFTSLKFDRFGNGHLAYIVQDRNHYPLKYAFWDRALKRWFVMGVANSASYCSLAVDSQGRPHISYADFGTLAGSQVRYAHWDGAVWSVAAIPANSETIGYYTSIALDALDRPIITFYELSGPLETTFKRRLRNVAWTGEYWELTTIDGTDGSGKFNSMASDPRGLLHLVYANVAESTQAMRYASWDGKWTCNLFTIQDVFSSFPRKRESILHFFQKLPLDKSPKIWFN